MPKEAVDANPSAQNHPGEYMFFDAGKAETPTLIHRTLAGLAQGWIDNPNQRTLGAIFQNRWNDEVFVNISLQFADPQAPDITDNPLAIKKAFIPPLGDIFDEHERYMSRFDQYGPNCRFGYYSSTRPEPRIRWDLFRGIFNLSRLRDEAADTLMPFNVELNQIHAWNSRVRDKSGRTIIGYDPRQIWIRFFLTDSEALIRQTARQIESLTQSNTDLQERISQGIGINQQ